MNRKSSIQKILREGLNLRKNNNETKTIYLVTYNDKYGDGTGQNIEAILLNKNDFPLWLRMHNYDRYQEGNMLENEDEFNVEEALVFTQIASVPDIPKDYDGNEFEEED
jgi:hypothetical protein